MNRLTPSHHGAMPPPPGTGQLARYGSAPGSFLAALADSVTRGGDPAPAPAHPVSRFYSGESSGLTSCESSCRTDGGGRPGALERAYGGSGEIRVPPPEHQHQQSLAPPGPPGGGGPGVSPLFRHSSSPAGLLSRLMTDPHGMAPTRGMGSYSQAGTDATIAHGHRQLSSQWSFSRQDLPQISEMGVIPDIGESIVAGGCNSSSDGAGAQSSSYLSRNFSVSSWDDTNSIMFSSPSKKAKLDAADDMVTSFSNIDSQFGLSESSLEMSGMDDYMQLQQDSIACRVRAKRGCATHPRSIAERVSSVPTSSAKSPERRTRISKRLKKLQDLVPNMDKQTNTSDMLDLAVEHIKELKGQVECVVVSITVIENAYWIVLAIFLAIFRYDPGAIGAACIHVNGDGHPATQHFSLTIPNV
ncbi:Transcription factor bHLH128 [Dichanthelium oligosanthes]|uniref:Transcription factor bHLH128 n=1 Tax=Dichanthelium oligosanthes TaxID=888268 RepID=A0A1E5VJP7_9POAL|nr:Transcription factor bHLH128 [Dichanthelium oligosanthes]